jgi:hypothetical protein
MKIFPLTIYVLLKPFIQIKVYKSKVAVVRDSHKLFLSLTGEFE